MSVHLEFALQNVCQDKSFDELRFWGRLRCKEGNYYIAVAYKFNEFEFPTKRFFYATSSFNFEVLPKPNPLFREKIEEFNGQFSGNPQTALFEVTETIVEEVQIEQVEAAIQEENAAPKPDLDADVEPEPIEEIPEPVRIEKRVTQNQVVCKEVDRLGFVVRAIEFECACFPKGALKMSITHQLRYNEAFRGLSATDAVKAQNWTHFRQPMTPDAIAAARKPEAVFTNDFLEGIEQDEPKRCWSLQLDLRREMVV